MFSMKSVSKAVVSFEMFILVAAISVLWCIEMTSQNVFSVAGLSLLAFISWKLREAVEALWWVSNSTQSTAEKCSHSEMRQMYLNELGHEMLRQMLQYFQTYNPKISPISWFLDKVQSELCAFRMACLRRGHELSHEAEALAFRYIFQRIQKDAQNNEFDRKIAQVAQDNWMRFTSWIEADERVEGDVEWMLGQPDPLRKRQTTAELEKLVVEHDGQTYLWSFGKQ